MCKTKRFISLFLITIFLLTGAVGMVYAANDNAAEQNTTIEKAVEESTKEHESMPENTDNKSETDTTEPRNGDLTKDSKYPFYDEVGVLSEETKNIILNINKNFEKEGAQIGVVVLNSLDGSSVEEKANKIFNTWGLGSKERNDGALLLVSISDRKFRLEVGDGLRNTVLSDHQAKEIINKMIPYFKKDAYNLGINAALFEIDQAFYEYRDFLTTQEKSEKEPNTFQSDPVEADSIEADPVDHPKNDDMYGFFNDRPSNDGGKLKGTMMAIILGVTTIFMTIMVGRTIVENIYESKEEKRAQKEEEERVQQFGPKHTFNINIKDQHGETKTTDYCDYSRKKVNKEEILDDVKYYVLKENCFGDDITDYDIESITPSIDSVRCKDIDNVEIIIKTVGEEQAFENDEDIVQATKDFYNSLTREERDFYRSRANADMQSDGGSNIWFYLYLYMLLKSDRSDSFRNSMSGANIASDRFYDAPDINQDTRPSYNDNDNSSDFIDTMNALNSLNSTFGGDNSSGSSFGGFGGGSSSGGGASGGW